MKPAKPKINIAAADTLMAMFGYNRIGRCPTCRNADCPHPKIKAKTPEKGCVDWNDEDHG